MGQENGLVLFRDMEAGIVVKCKPRYKVGDIVPIRETWKIAGWHEYDNGQISIMYKDETVYYYPTTEAIFDKYWQPNHNPNEEMWRPSIFMPKWASRSWVKITAVRCQRVNDITPEDCIAEGIDPNSVAYQLAFSILWDSINGKQKKGKPDLSFNRGPWCFAYNFEKVEDK
jgi:hypothetical protein